MNKRGEEEKECKQGGDDCQGWFVAEQVKDGSETSCDVWLGDGVTEKKADLQEAD